MAKKIDLNLGNREIKPAQIIEETHAAPAPEKVEHKYTKPISRRRRSKKDWVVKSVRMEREDYEKIEEFMKNESISFNALIIELLVEKGIL